MKALSLSTAHHEIQSICETLARGGVVVCPSDTTYGILVDATNHRSVEKLNNLKDRPRGKAISVFTDGFAMIEQYVDISRLTPQVRSLLPGSYTVVLPSLHKVDPLLESEEGGLGVRLIGGPMSNSLKGNYSTFVSSSRPLVTGMEGSLDFARDDALYKESARHFVTTLVAQYGKPLTATSANISGAGLCYTVDSFLHQLSEKKKGLVDLVIDAGELPHHPPSTVIILTGHDPVVTRANNQDFIHHETRNTKHETQTGEIAKRVFDLVRPNFGKKPVVILLDGELGGGKTTWTKYFAGHLGITDIVSPTYTYECEYPIMSLRGVSEANDAAISSTGIPTHGTSVTRFKHYDLYNITTEKDEQYLDISAQLTPDTVMCIEWPGQLSITDRAAMGIKAYVVRILFEYTSETERTVSVWWN